MSPEKRNVVVCLLLAVIVLALYNPAMRHPFVNYDDDRYVTENPHIRQGLTWDTFVWSLTSTEQANWHPLTWMSHALDCSLFRLNPIGHHFTSVLLHAANTMLLFLLLVWGTGKFAPSLFAAALFAVHPMNVESVVWIAERKNVLCTFFFFLTLWAYGWFARDPSWKRYLVVVFMFAAALASKPMVITLPFVLLLLDFWPLRRLASSGGKYRLPRLFVEKLPLLALSAASGVVTMHAQRAGGAVRTTSEFSFGVRVSNAIYAYAMYLWKAIWPAHLAPLYPHPGNSLAIWSILAAAFALILVTLTVWKLRSRPYLLMGWLWFLGTLVPVLGLVQVGDAAMADRYAYIPLIGIFVAIAFGVADFAIERSFKFVASAAAIGAVIALMLVTHRQIGYWQSNTRLWSHALAVTRNNFIAEDNLGGALILEGNEEEAYPHFQASARINPKDPMSHSNLGSYYQTHHRTDDAIAEYRTAISLTGDPGLLAETHANLGAAFRTIGKDEKARSEFQHALNLNADQFNAWLGLGLLARKQGDLNEATRDLSRSLEIRPTASGYLELGRTLAQAGHPTQALMAYEEALKLAPDLAEAQQAIDALQAPR